MDEESNSYEIKRPGADPAYASVSEAKKGLLLIRKALERQGWKTPTEFEMGRAQGVDIGRENKLGENPKVLHLETMATTDAWNEVEAALQYAGALFRKKAEYNASPVESGGRIIIVANSAGQSQIAAAR